MYVDYMSTSGSVGSNVSVALENHRGLEPPASGDWLRGRCHGGPHKVRRLVERGR